ncbi:MAG: DegT/DnrJ/EryC1/StrS family aminotransferase [Deltaproteobacteria bacterium]|nr:DegT/DnrJ/EryC1/StrS family aminotransferase [Deltaproteobacteria bacterium]
MSLPRIPLSEPHLVGNAERYLAECVQTNFVSSVGPFVERFEREIAEFVGAGYAVACSSGTAAIHLAMRALDVGVGDEVFVSSFTFVASANPVVYQGATPVLVDSERRTWNADPELIIEELERRARLGKKQPKAVEMVHVLGQPADMPELVRTCDRYGVTLIEDAAEALGATDTTSGPPRHVGTVGRIGCYSFNGNKIMTCGGGGMVVTPDETIARRAKHLSTQARIPGRAYDHDDVGYNYRLTNTAAALGVAQLEQLAAFIDAKRAIARRYDEAFADNPALTRPPRVPGLDATYWLYSLLLETRAMRDRVLDALAAQSIEARPLWTPLHAMAPYRHASLLGDGSVADDIAARGLSLPSSSGLTPIDQRRVIAEVLKWTT